jgi:hypothetical protein
MWDNGDKNGYLNSTNKCVGQINDGILKTIIDDLCDDVSNSTFLEIGTWNGLGSTRLFVSSLTKRTDSWSFYSLEANCDKSNDARKLYQGVKNVYILNEVITHDYSNIHDIFPELLTNSTYNYWNYVDVENLKNCELFLERKELPELFDVVFLDGGEFTTYNEFHILKNKCKYMILDDVNTCKCARIAQEIRDSPNEWKIVLDCPNERQGIMIAKKL